MEIPRLALGGVQKQLVTLLDAARADGSVHVAVTCGSHAIELSFADGRVEARAVADGLSLEDEAVLLILGWRRESARAPFRRDWHPDTPTPTIADDIVRAVHHAYQCDDYTVVLRVPEPQHAS